MTLTRGPGIYFEEQTTFNATYEQEIIPLFLIQTTTTISSLDDQIIKFTDFNAFATVCEGKGLTKTLTYIEDILTESENSTFYVYSIKTDTATAFTNMIKSTAHLKDVIDIVYIEETKSAQNNTITSKIAAIKVGLADNATNGIFREAYIIPYGTVNDAVTNAAEGTSSEEACITSLTSITSGSGDGRICIIVPDDNAGYIVGHCIGTPYNVEVGFEGLNNIKTTNIYNFNATQLLTIMNLGVLVIRKEQVQGSILYRIYLGVTTSFKESRSDGYIVARRVTDELLRQIEFECSGLIKDKVNTTTATLNNIVSGIVSTFIANQDVTQEGTILEVGTKGSNVLGVNGIITPVPTLVAIEVSTILQ